MPGTDRHGPADSDQAYAVGVYLDSAHAAPDDAQQIAALAIRFKRITFPISEIFPVVGE
jgi:hypothetical protein